MSDSIRVFLCDDHTLFREGLRKLLELEKDIEVVGDAGSGLETIQKVKSVSPDIVLMDIGMPGIDGVTATSRIKKEFPRINVIILTIYEDEPHIFEAIKAGAMGYVLKDITSDELIEAIRKVYSGEALIQSAIAAKVLKEFVMMDKRKLKDSREVLDELTERETEILRLITLGGSNKEIANRLSISEKTVKNHISNIFQKLHVNSRTKAALYALHQKKLNFKY